MLARGGNTSQKKKKRKDILEQRLDRWGRPASCLAPKPFSLMKKKIQRAPLTNKLEEIWAVISPQSEVLVMSLQFKRTPVYLGLTGKE